MRNRRVFDRRCRANRPDPDATVRHDAPEVIVGTVIVATADRLPKASDNRGLLVFPVHDEPNRGFELNEERPIRCPRR